MFANYLAVHTLAPYHILLHPILFTIQTVAWVAM